MGSVDVHARSGTMGEVHWEYVREVKKIKKNPKEKKLRRKKNRKPSAVRVTKDNEEGPKQC